MQQLHRCVYPKSLGMELFWQIPDVYYGNQQLLTF